jgi:hypothetical protein
MHMSVLTALHSAFYSHSGLSRAHSNINYNHLIKYFNNKTRHTKKKSRDSRANIYGILINLLISVRINNRAFSGASHDDDDDFVCVYFVKELDCHKRKG